MRITTINEWRLYVENGFQEPEVGNFILSSDSYNRPVTDLTRYVLHISDPDNRNSILENGLIPKMPSKKWMMKGFGSEPEYWNKSSIFATLFKDSIDVYDVKNISDYIFPLVGIGDDSPLMSMEEFLVKNNLVYQPKKGTGKYAFISNQENAEEWDNMVNVKYNSYLLKNSIFDVWAIDTTEVPEAKWFIDSPHDEEDSIYTTTKIPRKAIDLLVPYNNKMVKSADEAIINNSVKFKITETDDGDRINIVLNGIGHIILVVTYPQFEFEEELGEEGLDELGLDSQQTIGKIEHLEVEPDYRGKGYAKILMNKAIEIAKKKNLMPLFLNASPIQSASGLGLQDLTKFYESFGFKVILNQGGNNLMLKEN